MELFIPQNLSPTQPTSPSHYAYLRAAGSQPELVGYKTKQNKTKQRDKHTTSERQQASWIWCLHNYAMMSTTKSTLTW